MVRAARGDSDGAVADFDAALRLEPGLAGAYLERGSERVRGGDVKSAAADYAEAVRRRPGLMGEVLATVERRGVELLKERGDAARCCQLYRGTLRGLKPLFPERSEARRKIEEGLRRAFPES